MAKKTRSTKGSQTADASSLSFEQAVEALEALIDRIESGEIGLEQSLEEYERGVELLKRCRSIVDQAEQRIRELTLEDSESSEQ